MIREITPQDLNDKYFSLLSQLSGEVSEYNPKQLWDSYIEMKPNIMTYVYEDDGGIIGGATILFENKFLHCGSVVGHVEDVVVDSTLRSKGVGKSLMEACVEESKARGCYKIILDCSEANIPFYVKCGFTPDAYCMRMTLEIT